MPKNKGKNAFYFFMLDWKKKQEARGRTYPGGLRDVQCDQECSEEWQNLTPQQKGIYNARAKDSKVQAQASVVKKTAIGENLDEITLNEKKEQEFQQNMLQYIDSVISMGSQHKNLEKINFIFIHVNWFCRKEVGINKYEFYPAEFAIAEFSLENGIQNIYHEIVNIKIPLGWKSTAIETSQQTHRIPIELKDGQSDFSLMYNKLTKLLERNKSGHEYPPMFTTKDVTLVVDSLLTRMTHAVNADKDKFLVYSLEALFGALRNAAAQNANDSSIPLVVAESEFNKDVFFSIIGLECEFHKIMDGTSQYCSMAIVKRWGFTICDYCCELLGLKMIEGTHIPKPQSNFHINDQDAINDHLQKLSINDLKMASMSGVTEEYRIRVSERTYRDEQKRRNNSTKIDIIDHSKLNTFASKTSTVLTGRPLRLPTSKPRAVIDLEENNSPNIIDFPPLGRGAMLKKQTTNSMPPQGKGRGKILNS